MAKLKSEYTVVLVAPLIQHHKVKESGPFVLSLSLSFFLSFCLSCLVLSRLVLSCLVLSCQLLFGLVLVLLLLVFGMLVDSSLLPLVFLGCPFDEETPKHGDRPTWQFVEMR